MDNFIKNKIDKLSLEEKIEQLNYIAPENKKIGLEEYNYWNECLHGVARAGTATVFPQSIGLAAMFDDSLLEEIAEAISIEGRAKYNEYSKRNDRDIYKGLTFWSPNINIFRDPRWGRGQETFGEDPYLTSRLGVSFIKGLQGDDEHLRLAACAKHFAVHSGPEQGRHEFNAVSNPKDMTETYLPAFEAAVKEANVEIVMGAYNRLDGDPACAHPIIQDVLRDKWGFDGHFVSDYRALEDIYENHKFTKSHAETMAISLKAGCDLTAGHITKHSLEAVESGMLTEEDIDKNLFRVLQTRNRLGMFAESTQYDHLSYKDVESKEHIDLLKKITNKTLVLLKNNDILPLAKDKYKNIAVIGPNANSRTALLGNYSGTPSKSITLLEGLQNSSNDARIFYSAGSHLYKDNLQSSLARKNDRLAEAVSIASHSDLIILGLGFDVTIEGEEGDPGNIYGSGDRPNLYLPDVQHELLELMLNQDKPVILVNMSGGPVSLKGLEDHNQLKAYIQAWYPGAYGGQVIADAIYGETEPSGKLPVTIYKNTDDLPDIEDYSMENRTYKNFTGEIVYPFGYGLNYNSIDVKDVKIKEETNDLLTISIELENKSNHNGEEVVQVYYEEDSKHAPKNPSLVGFKRVEMSANIVDTFELVLNKKYLTVVNDEGQRVNEGGKRLLHISFSQANEESLALTNKSKITLSL